MTSTTSDVYYGGTLQPYWLGVYQVSNTASNFLSLGEPFKWNGDLVLDRSLRYSYWDGQSWYHQSRNPDEAKEQYRLGVKSYVQNPFFRGLARNPLIQDLTRAWPFPARIHRGAETMEQKVSELVHQLAIKPLQRGEKLYATEDQVSWTESPTGNSVTIKLRFKPNVK